MYLISGMHRSGTSLVAKLFHAAGADMGDPAGFHRADKWNPTGYYEQRGIIELNLKLLHGPWGRLAYLRLPSPRAVLRRAEPLSATISRFGREYADKVVKENRFCLTLPGWRAHGGDVRKVLVCLREPRDVALSIRLRNGLPLWYTYRLWRIHLTRLLEQGAGLDVRFVRYEHLLNPALSRDELRGALRFMGLERSDADIAAILEKAVQPVRNDGGGASVVRYPERVRSLWAELVEKHASQSRA